MCDFFILDMCAASFGTCKCGEHKTKHSEQSLPHSRKVGGGAAVEPGKKVAPKVAQGQLYAFESGKDVFRLLSGLEMKLEENQLTQVEEALAKLSMDSVEVLTSENAAEVVTETNLSAALVKAGMDELVANGVSCTVISAFKKKYWFKKVIFKGSAGGAAAGGAASYTNDEPPIVVGHNNVNKAVLLDLRVYFLVTIITNGLNPISEH